MRSWQTRENLRRSGEPRHLESHGAHHPAGNSGGHWLRRRVHGGGDVLMKHSEQPCPARELFYEARAELNKDSDFLRFKDDEKPADAALACLFCRIITHLKAIEVLYANDLALEVDILLRGCIEAIFWMGAIVNEPDDTVIKMENEFKYQNFKQRKRILSEDPANMNLSPTERRELERAQEGEKIDKGNRLNIFCAAKRAEITGMYIPYANLSNSAVHSSIHSLNRHLVMKPDKTVDCFTALVVDPNWDYVFRLGCCIIFFTKNFLNDGFKIDRNPWESDLMDRLKKLNMDDKNDG
jgi:Family of unknown function (DUF5677)